MASPRRRSERPSFGSLSRSFATMQRICTQVRDEEGGREGEMAFYVRSVRSCFPCLERKATSTIQALKQILYFH
jgi:hypothetical protein